MKRIEDYHSLASAIGVCLGTARPPTTQNRRVNVTDARGAWIDSFVMCLARLQPSLPTDLAHAVATAEFDDGRSTLEPEIAAELYASREAPRRE